MGPGEVALLAYLSSMLITLALYQFLGRRYNAFRVERSLREVGGILGPGRVTLDEESITAQGPPGRALTWWSAILEMSEASNTYLLWTDPGAAIMVPKDAFKTAAECAAFETLVAARIAHGADRHSS